MTAPPRLLLDACVLFPTVLREVLTGAAAAGFFRPLWSARILEEWARATRRLGPVAETIARGEIAALRAAFPDAEVPPAPHLVARLHLPDDNDLHVLAAAIAGNADGIVTLNRADFPRATLHAEGLTRRDPDGLLWEFASQDRDRMAAVLAGVQARATAASGRPQDLRALLRRARLYRLARLMTG